VSNDFQITSREQRQGTAVNQQYTAPFRDSSPFFNLSAAPCDDKNHNGRNDNDKQYFLRAEHYRRPIPDHARSDH
jgi:hypothetical protein